MGRIDIPEIIHAGVVILLLVGIVIFTIAGVAEGWL